MFEVELVGGVEGVEGCAIDVEDGDDFAVVDDGDDNLTIGGRGTGYMSREVMDVGDDDRLGTLPRGATDSFAERNTGTRNGTLEGP